MDNRKNVLSIKGPAMPTRLTLGRWHILRNCRGPLQIMGKGFCRIDALPVSQPAVLVSKTEEILVEKIHPQLFLIRQLTPYKRYVFHSSLILAFSALTLLVGASCFSCHPTNSIKALKAHKWCS